MEQIKIEGIDAPLSRLVYGTGTAILEGDDQQAAFECLDMAWEECAKKSCFWTKDATRGRMGAKIYFLRIRYAVI